MAKDQNLPAMKPRPTGHEAKAETPSPTSGRWLATDWSQPCLTGRGSHASTPEANYHPPTQSLRNKCNQHKPSYLHAPMCWGLYTVAQQSLKLQEWGTYPNHREQHAPRQPTLCATLWCRPVLLCSWVHRNTCRSLYISTS